MTIALSFGLPISWPSGQRGNCSFRSFTHFPGCNSAIMQIEIEVSLSCRVSWPILAKQTLRPRRNCVALFLPSGQTTDTGASFAQTHFITFQSNAKKFINCIKTLRDGKWTTLDSIVKLGCSVFCNLCTLTCSNLVCSLFCIFCSFYFLYFCDEKVCIYFIPIFSFLYFLNHNVQYIFTFCIFCT